MINTILVEDDLYIQKHFAERLKSNEIFRLVGVYRDAFEAEKNCNLYNYSSNFPHFIGFPACPLVK